MITISLNGESRHLEAPLTVAALVSELGLENRRLAVEINQQIVPRSSYDTHSLQHEDRVEIVQAIGGG